MVESVPDGPGPDPRLARALFALPGHLYGDGDGGHWRWDGDQWEPLRPGDTVLDPDRVTWRVWTGRELLLASLEEGAVVRVSWRRDGVDWHRQLCAVADIERSAETHLLVRPWPAGTEVAVVPAFAVELVAPPAAAADQ
jgi:hypothetical protein